MSTTLIVSEIGQAKTLVNDRYGKCFERQEPSGEWWIISESGMILGNGETSDEAWVKSAFMTREPHHLCFPD